MAALLVLNGLAVIACDAGDQAASTARNIRDDIATTVGEARPTPSDRTQTTAPVLTRGTETPAEPEVAAVFAALESLESAQRGSAIEYDRRDWRHWIDADKDCQNTRAEVLIQESLAAVSFATDERCRVMMGEWIGPWSGETFGDASDVDIDHHVPLGHAHVSGGWRWDADRKRAYANDLTNPNSLQVTDSSVNRSKGKKPPDEWRPENPAGWCRYAADWISVKEQWDLTVTKAEFRALADMLDTCDNAGSWGLKGATSE